MYIIRDDKQIACIMDAIKELKKYVHYNQENSQWAFSIAKTLEETRNKYKTPNAVSELEATLDLLELAFISFGKILSSFKPKVGVKEDDCCQECGATINTRNVILLCRDCYKKKTLKESVKGRNEKEEWQRTKVVRRFTEENIKDLERIKKIRESLEREVKNRVPNRNVMSENQIKKFNKNVMSKNQIRKLNNIEQQIKVWNDYSCQHPEYKTWVDGYIKTLERMKKRLS